MAVLSANEPVVTTPPANLRCEEVVYARPQALTDVYTHYCPGCTHGIAHRLVAEAIDELGIREDTILAVSYTHLDVYKRQVMRTGARLPGVSTAPTTTSANSVTRFRL